MLSEFEKTILEATQLIIRDRTWNTPFAESKAKVTDENITKLLNPQSDKEAKALHDERDKLMGNEVHDGVCGETCSTCDDASGEVGE